MSGDKNDLTPLTAFTLIALLEANESQQDNPSTDQQSLVIGRQVLDKALSCLSVGNAEDPYTTALTGYALTLANRAEDARVKINWMMNQAQRNNSLIWWQKTGLTLAYKVLSMGQI